MTTTRTDRPGTLLQVDRTARTWPLRVCLALNLIGAGVPGAILLFMPSWAIDIIGAEASTEVALLVGAVWTSIGLVSALGLTRPTRMIGILAVQIAYKSLYVALVGVPGIIAGTASAATTGLTIGFAVIVVAWSAALLSTLSAWR